MVGGESPHVMTRHNARDIPWLEVTWNCRVKNASQSRLMQVMK